MTRFLRLFRQFRDLESTEHQRSLAEDALREEIRALAATREELEASQSACQMEQVRRISAEAIASERQAEIDRLSTAVRDLREDYKDLTKERIRSVDAINTRLMEAKVPEQPVDFSKHQPVKKVDPHSSLVNKIRATHQAVDMAILRESMNGFTKRRTMNSPVGIVPTLEDIAKTDITHASPEPVKTESAA